MFFVLQCGGIPFDGNTIKERSLGGSETAAYYVAKGLAEVGHKVTIFTNCEQGGVFDGVRYEPMGRVGEDCPFGENFHHYAINTPHDVCIIQRHPQAFSYRWQSKINLWWLHDLALYRTRDVAARQMWNIDKTLVVSEYHRDQVSRIYDIPKEGIVNIRNGVGEEARSAKGTPGFIRQLQEDGKKILTYSSRPERGLEHLLRPGGIMDRLGDDYQLLFCGYDNTTPAMADYYRSLWRRADEMPNVMNLGPITKPQLATLMANADLHVYPTAFEEVSCITAMECMAAGLPMVTSAFGALPETCEGAGVELIPLVDGDTPDENAFVAFIESFFDNPHCAQPMKEAQLRAAERYSWDAVVDRIIAVVEEQFTNVSESSKMAAFLRNSDIVALLPEISPQTAIGERVMREINDLYDWIGSDEDVAAHYATRTEPLRRANVTNSPRFKYISGRLTGQITGTLVDWGCNAGHFTIGLAKINPQGHFIGVDFDEKAVEFAREWAKDEECTNVEFMTVNEYLEVDPVRVQILMAGEVLEHAPDLEGFFGKLPPAEQYIFTTPYGPWESLSFRKMGGYREHVHHFDRADLFELFGHFPGYKSVNLPNPTGNPDLCLGFYVTEFRGEPGLTIGNIDYTRKLATQKPRESLSVCILVGNSEGTLLNCLNSVYDVADEIVLRFEDTVNGPTVDVVENFMEQSDWQNKIVAVYGRSPLDIGFDAARNESIEAASGDWILWIDTDEVLKVKDGWEGLLRANCLNGYAVAQNHFSMDPAGILKVDYPCRLFRADRGIKFFGMVHEHPERELNEGVGHVQMTGLIELMHYGYTDESVRRGRFTRNFTLLEQDRIKHPERKLGAMLWLRDCGQRIQYAIEQNGKVITPELIDIAEDGVKTWEWLLENADLRMICDSLEFYSICVEVLGPGIEAAMSAGASRIPNGMPDSLPTYKGIFYSQEHIEALCLKLLRQGSEVDTRYF